MACRSEETKFTRGTQKGHSCHKKWPFAVVRRYNILFKVRDWDLELIPNPSPDDS